MGNEMDIEIGKSLKSSAIRGYLFIYLQKSRGGRNGFGQAGQRIAVTLGSNGARVYIGTISLRYATQAFEQR